MGICPALLALTALSPQAAPENQGYYMQPTLRGNEIVFVSQGDLWHVGLAGGVAHPLTSHVAPCLSPKISPDGKTVAFTGTYEGPPDVYTMPLGGGLPKRITYRGGIGVQGWSPDGKIIVGTRNRSTLPDPRLLSIDPATRAETPIPLNQASDGSYDGTGKTFFFTRLAFQGSNTKRYEGGTAQSVWKYTDGAAEAVPLTKGYIGTSKSPMWWNGRVYFLSDRDGVMNLWSMDPNGGSLKQHTTSKAWDLQSASLDNGKVVYQLGADVHVFDIATGADKLIDITLESDFESLRDRWQKEPMQYLTSFDYAADGSKVALTARGQVFVAPVEPGRFVEVSRKPGVRYREAMFSADGKSVYALSDQSGETEWWKMPANGVGKAEQISSGSTVLTLGGKLSPDGKKIAYYNKDLELWVVDTTTKVSTKIATGKDDVISDFSWSPDSKWLSYVLPTQTFARIYLYSFETSASTAVTTDRADSTSPAWSPDGKWLYFLSDRTFRSVVGSPWGPRAPEPFFDRQSKIYSLALSKGQKWPFQAPDELTDSEKPVAKPPTPSPTSPGDAKPADAKPSNEVKIELDGLQGRLWEVPVAAANYQRLSASADRLFVINAAVGGAPNLEEIDVKNKDVASKVLVPGTGSYTLSQDGKKLLVNRGGAFFSIPSGLPAGAPLDKPVDLSAWSFVVDPKEEWKQMFTEAWRLERDYFYDRNMLSLDWPSIRKKYEPLVDRIRDRSELSNVLSQMIGELSTLHMFVYGGDNRTATDAIGTAGLGGEFEKDSTTGGYKITRIYQGDPDYPDTFAPLVRPGVDLSVGDTILAVNGVDTLLAPTFDSLFRNQAGRQVLLHVKTADGTERDCIVKPIASGQEADLRYTDWELSRRQAVEKASSNDIGYLHLRAMGQGDIATFQRDFYPVFNRSGIIIDVRHNGGGNIDSWIIEKLLRKAWFFWQPRVGNPYWNMQYAFRGHVVVLCDEGTASDGEAFTEGIKRLNIGKVIGTRTWGGEVWLSSSNFLGDGGIATAAEFGVYGPEGKWLVEGHGVDPDIVVDNLPHATYLGKDAQLEAAIAYLQKEIKDHPIPVPAAPKYPNKTFPPVKG